MRGVCTAPALWLRSSGCAHDARGGEIPARRRSDFRRVGRDEAAWFCGRVVDIQSAVERMKDPNYALLLAKLKSSLRKTLAALEPLYAEAVDYLAGGLPVPNMTHAMAELRAFEKTAERLLAMPKPDCWSSLRPPRTMIRGAASRPAAIAGAGASGGMTLPQPWFTSSSRTRASRS